MQYINACAVLTGMACASIMHMWMSLGTRCINIENRIILGEGEAHRHDAGDTEEIDFRNLEIEFRQKE